MTGTFVCEECNELMDIEEESPFSEGVCRDCDTLCDDDDDEDDYDTERQKEDEEAFAEAADELQSLIDGWDETSRADHMTALVRYARTLSGAGGDQ
jgi:hypothetical protein